MSLALSPSNLIRSVTKESLFEFTLEFWNTLEEDQLVTNWHIKYFCYLFEKEIERIVKKRKRKKDIYINVPPGSTKSLIFSVMGPAWVWARYPWFRFICGSHTSSLSLDLAVKSRKVIESDKYQEAFPHVILEGDQNVKGYFRTTRSGFRYSLGTNEKPTGRHAHLIIVDDPMSPDDIHSEANRKRVHVFMRQSIPSRKVDKKVSGLIVVQQRLGQDDTTGERLARDPDSVFHVRLPARVSDKVKPERFKAKYVNGLLDPVRLSDDVLKAAEIDLGVVAYQSQYEQEEAPPEGSLFHVQKIITIDELPDKIYRVVRYWDKAASYDAGCYTVGVKMAQIKLDKPEDRDYAGMYRYIVLDVQRFQLDSYSREMRIKETTHRDGKKVAVGLEQEPGGSGKESAQNTANRLGGFQVELDNVSGKKEVRAIPFSSQVNAGSVMMVRATWNDAYIEELRCFPDGKYKDQVDASSGAFNLLVTKRPFVGGF